MKSDNAMHPIVLQLHILNIDIAVMDFSIINISLCVLCISVHYGLNVDTLKYNEDEICKSCKFEHANKKTLLSSAV